MNPKNVLWQNNKVHTTRYARQLRSLNQVSQILASGVHLQQAFSKVLDLLDKELGLNRGTISLLAPDNNEIKIESAHGLSKEKSKRITYRLGEGITGKVVQTGKTIIVPKISQEPLFLNRFERWNVTKQELSFICAPIIIGNEVIGTLSVDKTFREEVLLEEDAQLLNIVSSMIAIVFKAHREAAIERQLLENETQRLNRQLEDKKRRENILGNGSLKERTDQFERDIIIESLERLNGNISAVARDLKTTTRIIRYKIKELKIEYKQYRRKRG